MMPISVYIASTLIPFTLLVSTDTCMLYLRDLDCIGEAFADFSSRTTCEHLSELHITLLVGERLFLIYQMLERTVCNCCRALTLLSWKSELLCLPIGHFCLI